MLGVALGLTAPVSVADALLAGVAVDVTVGV